MDKTKNFTPSVTKPFAVVTGASSGIGYELAVQFAKNNFDLLIAAEDEGLNAAARTLEGFGAQVQAVQVDLATFEGVEELWEAIEDSGRKLDAVAINAGVGVGGKFWETELEEEINMINLNVVSTVHLAKRVAQGMIERSEGGKILFTSSVAATMPGPYLTVYAATKAFVQSLSDGLRYELKEKGISVTALLPGATDTNFFERAHMEDTKVGAEEKDDPAVVAQQGFEALMEGKEYVLGGSLKTRMSNAANDLLPESVKAKMHAGMAKPGSAAG